MLVNTPGHSSTYQSLFSIDLMLGNSLTRNLTIRVEYFTWGISVHPLMLLVLQIPGVHWATSWSWKLNPFWLSVIDTGWVSDTLSEYFFLNWGSTNVHTVWDALNAFLRGSLIHKISRLKIIRGQLEKACRDRVRLTEAAYIAKRYSTRLETGSGSA